MADSFGSLANAFVSTFREGRAAKASVVTHPVVSNDLVTHRFKAFAADDGVIIGIGSYAEMVDLDNEVVRKSDLVKMAYDFNASKERKFRANHKADIDCDLVASWPGAPMLKSGKVLTAGEPIPDDDPIVGISLEKGSETAWFLAVRPHDPLIAQAAKAGDVAGFSWSGYVTRTAVKE